MIKSEKVVIIGFAYIIHFLKENGWDKFAKNVHIEACEYLWSRISEVIFDIMERIKERDVQKA